MSEAIDNTQEEDVIDEVVNKAAEDLGAAVKHFQERPEPELQEYCVEPTGTIELTKDGVTKVNGRTAEEIVDLQIATERFKVSLTERSFSGRNPELGPMIKCAQCGRRHRDNVKHDPIKYKEGTTQAEHGRPAANAAGWRAKPGKMYWIKELKKFVTINR
jgi:hypothetical protein